MRLVDDTLSTGRMGAYTGDEVGSGSEQGVVSGVSVGVNEVVFRSSDGGSAVVVTVVLGDVVDCCCAC